MKKKMKDIIGIVIISLFVAYVSTIFVAYAYFSALQPLYK